MSTFKAWSRSVLFQEGSDAEKKSDCPLIFLSDEQEDLFLGALKHNPKISELLDDIRVNPLTGTGQPEVLKGEFRGYKGCVSRRIDKENRFIYKVSSTKEILIISWEGHYDD